MAPNLFHLIDGPRSAGQPTYHQQTTNTDQTDNKKTINRQTVGARLCNQNQHPLEDEYPRASGKTNFKKLRLVLVSIIPCMMDVWCVVDG